MSGHSKWATTHRAKSATDAKRGAIFTKLTRAITLAAKSGPDPETNFKLRLAVDQARAANMPKDNIERAIARGLGQGAGEQLAAVTYEGFAPHGVAVIIEGLTDNKNRTSQELRHVMEVHGGTIGAPGSVSWQFARVGQCTVPRVTDDDELALIDQGATDLARAAHGVTITCPPDRLEAIRRYLHQRGFTPEAELTLRPATTIALTGEQVPAVRQFLDAVAQLPDVQNVYHNAAKV